MAGHIALADRAHLLEDEIKQADETELSAVTALGAAELTTLLLVNKPNKRLNEQSDTDDERTAGSSTEPQQVHSATSSSSSMGITESSFEDMLSLATRATLSQAQLGESLQRLRDACRDIEVTANRLQRIPGVQSQSAAIDEMLSDLDNSARMLSDALMDAEAEHTQGSRADSTLHQTLIRAQLLQFGESHTRLQQTINDAATETDKNVRFEFNGAHIAIDKSLFRKILTPLEHLVRNAVVHGIESPAEREASGKPVTGTVSVDAVIDGTDLVVAVYDDGAGIDLGAVNAELESRDRNSIETMEELRSVICESGFSTVDKTDQLAGRGLGLSSVQEAVVALGGSFHLSESDSGGSSFHLRIPQKVRINQVVLIEHRERQYAIPVNFVHTVCDERQQLSGADIQFNDIDYTCCTLNGLFAPDDRDGSGELPRQAVLIKVHHKHLALMVDRVVGFREVVAQPLGSQLAKLQRYLGGSVLANGKVLLIPDFNRLLPVGAELVPTISVDANTQTIQHALVVDDSITMRIAAEQMLQKMGIRPIMARDGVEAIEIIAESQPDLLLVDIDMPRMDGFDFLRHLKVQHPDHAIPIVMISTRDNPRDRNQALELGALDYLVKPYSESELHNSLNRVGFPVDGLQRKNQ